MNSRVLKRSLCVGAFVLAGVSPGCGKDEPVYEPLVIEGQLALATFPESGWTVRAVRGDYMVASKQVEADGRFSISIPAGKDYRLEFVSTSGTPLLVFPRKPGSIEVTFDVKPIVNGTFNLGGIRYIGNPMSSVYAFQVMSSGAVPDTDDVECEDGIDAKTGGVCVDDDDEEGAGVCEQEGDNEQDGDNNECENGIDAHTGAACTDSNDDGECHNGVDTVTGAPCTDEDPLPVEAAVADHNLPRSVGCEPEDDDDEEEEEED